MKYIRLLSVFDVETGMLSEHIAEDVTAMLRNNEIDIEDDDCGLDIFVNPREGYNAHLNVFGKDIEVQTRVFISLNGDLFGLTKEDVESEIERISATLESMFTILGRTWSITECDTRNPL